MSDVLTNRFSQNKVFSDRKLILLVAFFALNMGILVHSLGTHELWSDEIITVKSISLGWVDLFRERYSQAHSPLYFAFLKFINLVDPSNFNPWVDEFWLRLPSAIFVSAAGTFLVSACMGRKQPLVCFSVAIIWIFHPFLIEYGQEARPYALLIFFLSLGLWANINAIEATYEGQRGSFNIYSFLSSVGSVGAVITIPVGIIAATFLEAAAWTYARKSNDMFRLWQKRCVIVWPVLILIAAIFLPAVLNKADSYWLDKKTPFSIGSIFSSVDGIYMLDPKYIFGTGLLPDVLGLAILFSFMFFIFRRISLADNLSTHAAFLGVGFLLAIIFISMYTSLLTARYFAPCIIGFILLLASGMQWESKKKQTYAINFLVCAAFICAGLSYSTSNRRTEYKSILNFVAVNKLDNVPIITGDNVQNEINFYAQNKNVKVSLASNVNSNLHLNKNEKIIIYISKKRKDPLDFKKIFSHWCRTRIGRFQIFVAAPSKNFLPSEITPCEQ